MFIWGRGGVIPLIAFGCALLTELFTRTAFGNDASYYQTHGWPKLVAFWVAAGFVYALRPWFRVGQERTRIDKKSGQQVQVSLEAEFFFVRARYWPAVLIALGLMFFFYDSHGSA
jgi:hypothetical protein